MANNRDETKAAVTAALVPTLTLTQHIALLNDEFVDSALFRKDVIGSETPAGGTVTIDYSDKDLATATITANLTVSFSNLENGDVKYLEITKNATNTISFSGATDISQRQDYIDASATLVVYRVVNKNSNIYVESINIDNSVNASETTKGILEVATTAEAQALTLDTKIITPAKLADVNGGLLTKVIDIGDWNMNTTPTPSGIAHGLTLDNIRDVQVLIREDSGGADINRLLTDSDNSGVVNGNVLIASTNIVLTRLTGGDFDSTSFQDTSYNRGWITIRYIP